MQEIVFSFLAALPACLASGMDGQIIAYRDEDVLLVRSFFSETHDIVLKIEAHPSSQMPNEKAYLIPKTAPLLDYSKYPVMHDGRDDFTGYPVRMYGILGGNHGSAYGRKVKLASHGLTVADLGAELTAAGKGTFYILRIIDEDHILIHPENQGVPGFPKFAALVEGDQLFKNGQELSYTELVQQQVYPGNRRLENVYLVNGKTPLANRVEVLCDFLDHIIDYEIVMPDAIVAKFKNQPGKEHIFNAPDLPALLNVRNVFQYQGYGACVISTSNKVLCDLPGYDVLAVILVWAGEIAQKKTTEFYIPKLKPLLATGLNAPAIECDFSAIYAMPAEMPVQYKIGKADCLDPSDPPDRFVRLVGDTEREIGVALGYSLFEGVTAKRLQGAHRDTVYHLYRTKKMYPYCLNLKNCHKGDQYSILSYRQYFDPQREPEATAFYFNRQKNSDVVYLDFHQKVEEKLIALPRYMAGKTIHVLEQTPSVILHTPETVPEAGISLSVKDSYGYIVLKLD